MSAESPGNAAGVGAARASAGVAKATDAFDGAVIAITGGASGIGLTTARHLASLGATVALVDLNRAALDAASEQLAAEGVPGVGLAADVTRPDDMASVLAEVVERFGSLDGFVTCAGIRQAAAPVVELSLEEWRRVVDVDLGGTFVSCQAAARIMGPAGRGSIVNIASLAVEVPRINAAAYNAAKSGVVSLTRTLALELAAQRVRVNCVCPGPTNTGFAASWNGTGEANLDDRIFGNTAKYRPGIPLRRIAEPIDIAQVIAFLLSGASSFMTGQALFIDGGESII